MSRSQPADVHALLHEQLDALLDESNNVMNHADFGQTVHDLDDFLLDEGRLFLHKVYQQKLQERIQQTEADPESQQCPKCKKKRTTKTPNRNASPPLADT